MRRFLKETAAIIDLMKQKEDMDRANALKQQESFFKEAEELGAYAQLGQREAFDFLARLARRHFSLKLVIFVESTIELRSRSFSQVKRRVPSYNFLAEHVEQTASKTLQIGGVPYLIEVYLNTTRRRIGLYLYIVNDQSDGGHNNRIVANGHIQ